MSFAASVPLPPLPPAPPMLPAPTPLPPLPPLPVVLLVITLLATKRVSALIALPPPPWPPLPPVAGANGGAPVPPLPVRLPSIADRVTRTVEFERTAPPSAALTPLRSPAWLPLAPLAVLPPVSRTRLKRSSPLPKWSTI